MLSWQQGVIAVVIKYNHRKIEPKWQKVWQETGLYRTPDTTDKPKYYCLDFFPYPSGDGLSVGHCRNYVPTDVVSRYKRMRGSNVLHPMGYDAFGQPAENEAIRRGIHPKVSTAKYTANYRRQLQLIGTSYDWDREINSSHPDFYRWTQWFFLLLYKRGLAYRATAPVNWCPSCATVLANEEVEEGHCWRCDTLVTKRDLMQWFFRITAYADALADDLDTVDWPEKIVLMQRNWIGRSTGVEFDLGIKGSPEKIRVFTTRPDTVYGMTFAVLAPEHPLVDKLTTPDRRAEVEAYIEMARRESEIERLSTEKERTGVFIGAYAVNPMNGEEIPIYIADYVLPGYGTGAIMAVPGHDARDFDFARKYHLPIPVVIAPPGWQPGQELTPAYLDDGMMVNSGPFNGMPSSEGIERVADYMEQQGIGTRKVNYRMRDWLISRQRYWGAPIPVVYCERCGEVPVPEEQLPVLLPELERFQPSGTGKSPLANVPEFVNTACPHCGGRAQRETDTMGGFACSSWYFLRFTSPHYDRGPFEPHQMRYWMPVDLYVGGAEHAVMHLLYARFWTKVMCDAGVVPFKEPFQKLMNQGMVLGADGQKMSKSKGNVITPDDVVARYGADSLRGYELFIGPFEQEVAWSEQGISGVYRFLNRAWGIVLAGGGPKTTSKGEEFEARERDLRRMTHKTLKRVTGDIERSHFNTAVAALMEYVNYLQSQRKSVASSPAWQEARETLMLMLAPIAPHMAEELWQHTGHAYSIHQQAWPAWDEGLAAEETITLVIQVNGKVRDKVQVTPDITEAEARKAALSSARVAKWTAGKQVINMVYVPGRLVNLVVK